MTSLVRPHLLDELVAGEAAAEVPATVVTALPGMGAGAVITQAIVQHGARGRRAVRGRAALGHPVPLRAIRQVLAELVRRGGAARVRGRGAFGRTIDAVLDGGIVPPPVDVAAALCSMLPPGEGWLLAFEDLHAADPASLAVLEAVAEQAGDRSLHLLMTARPSPAVEAWAWQLADRGLGRIVPLLPLDVTEVRALAAAHLAPADLEDAVVRAIAERAGGRPTCVDAIAQAVAGHGARPLRDRLMTVVPGRWAAELAMAEQQLGPGPVEVLEWAAILGSPVQPDLLDRVVSGGRSRVDRDLDALVTADLVIDVVADGLPCRQIRDPLVGAAATARLDARQQRARGGSAIEALAAPSGDPAHDAGRLGRAAHLAEGREEVRRAALLRVRQARRSFDIGELAQAANALRRAIELDDAGTGAAERLLLVELLGEQGTPQELQAQVRQLLDDPRLTPTLAAELHLLLVDLAFRSYRPQDVEGHLAAARRHLRDSDDPGVHVAALVAQAEALLVRSDPEGAAATAASAVVAARRQRMAAHLCRALHVQAFATYFDDRGGPAAALLREAEAIARDAGMGARGLELRRAAATVDGLWTGEVTGLSAVAAQARRSGVHTTLLLAELALAVDGVIRLDVGSARDHARELGVVQAHAGNGVAGPLVDVVHSAILALTGQHEEAARTLAAVAVGADPTVDAYVMGYGHGLAALVRWDLPAADAWLTRALDAALAVPLHPLMPAGLAALVAAMRRPADATPRRLAASLYGDLDVGAVPGLVAAAEAVAAVLQGRSGPAHDHWQQAERAFAGVPAATGAQALARLALADVTDTRPVRWVDPSALVWAAQVHFEEGSATALVAACRSRLARRGVPVPRHLRAADVPRPLREARITPREAEVLALLVDGFDGAQIAAHLVISKRTVDKHVERLRAKLGATTRAEVQRRGARLLSSTPSPARAHGPTPPHS